MSKPTKREEALHVVRYIFGLKNFLLTVWRWGRKFPDLRHKASFFSSGLISVGGYVGFGFSQGWAWISSFPTSSKVVVMVVVCRAWGRCPIRETHHWETDHSNLEWVNGARSGWRSRPPCLLIPVWHKDVLIFCICWEKKRVDMHAVTPCYGGDPEKFICRGRNPEGANMVKSGAIIHTWKIRGQRSSGHVMLAEQRRCSYGDVQWVCWVEFWPPWLLTTGITPIVTLHGRRPTDIIKVTLLLTLCGEIMLVYQGGCGITWTTKSQEFCWLGEEKLW